MKTSCAAWSNINSSSPPPPPKAAAGGNVRSSEAPVEHIDGRIHLVRDASVISYGAQADAIVTTARRDADAIASDQVLVVLEKKNYSLERTGGWDTLGMRGTCSSGFNLKAVGDAAQIMPVPYETIHSQSMVPAAHLMWSGVWAGIAAGAVERGAQIYAQSGARWRSSARPSPFHHGAGEFAQAARADRSITHAL